MLIYRSGMLRRTLSAFLALLLLVIQGGVEAAHACPVHDAAVVDLAEHAGVAQSGHGQHGAPAAADDTESEHCCTCLGSCLTAPVASPASASAEFDWLALESTSRTERVRTDVRRSPLPRLLPYATAPPLS